MHLNKCPLIIARKAPPPSQAQGPAQGKCGSESNGNAHDTGFLISSNISISPCVFWILFFHIDPTSGAPAAAAAATAPFVLSAAAAGSVKSTRSPSGVAAGAHDSTGARQRWRGAKQFCL